tara:strand:- start:842 stop:1060 length:219 start_codon:yes stop_codon:yes gene_type:complete
MVITRVVDKNNPHDSVQVIRVLIIDGDTSFVLKRLTNSTLEKILVEFGKKESVQWSLTLLQRIEVEVITHLI